MPVTAPGTGRLPDGTLGGYLAKHARPPAFEALDGHSYSVDVLVTEDGPPEAPFSGALLFVRWSMDGAEPVGHLETDYLVSSPTAEAALARLHALTLHEVKEQLDRAVQSRNELPDW